MTRDRRFDPGQIADVLVELNAEIIALQEITLDQGGALVRRLERASDMRAIDGTLFERGVGRYGNVILSRRPVLAHRLHALSFPKREPRGAVDTVVDIQGARIRVCATHLGLTRRERKYQIAQLSMLLAGNQTPTVLLGDFNIWWQARALAPLARLGFEHITVRSFPTWTTPLFALDRILANPPAVIQRCWRHDTPLARTASDHFPILAEIEVQR